MKILRKYIALFICCLTFILGVFPANANMAKPYSDGTESSILFGSKNCSVLSESIDLTAIAPIDTDDYAYQIKYKISYCISFP